MDQMLKHYRKLMDEEPYTEEKKLLRQIVEDMEIY